jgi:hypothetical protein
MFEGLTGPLRGRGELAVRGQVAQRHEADTSLAAQCRTVAGMASPRELVKQRPGVIRRRVRVVAQPAASEH